MANEITNGSFQTTRGVQGHHTPSDDGDTKGTIGGHEIASGRAFGQQASIDVFDALDDGGGGESHAHIGARGVRDGGAQSFIVRQSREIGRKPSGIL
jgi:hypothetical protein